MLQKNTSKRPDIDQIMSMEIVTNRIKGLICRTFIKKEFNQTMVHNICGDTKQPYIQVPLNDANIKHYLKPKNEPTEEIHEFERFNMIDKVKENLIIRKKSSENKRDNTPDRIAKIIEKAKNINGAKRVKTPDKKENFIVKNK